MAQRQRRDWRDATTIIEMFLARRMFSAAQPLPALLFLQGPQEPVSRKYRDDIPQERGPSQAAFIETVIIGPTFPFTSPITLKPFP
jgi:hypothetical protein